MASAEPRHDANRRLLRARDATAICLDVGFTSLGTFSRTFSEIVGSSPSAYREREQAAPRAAIRAGVPGCMAAIWDRPSSTLGEDTPGRRD